MPAFPTLSVDHDSSKYSVELDDNTMSQDLEGGYTATRKRTTRKPRRTWTIGYTHITDADKNALVAFYEQNVSAVIFTWLNIEDGQTYNVRFVGKMKFTYQGKGPWRRWDCDLTLKQA